MSKKQVKEWVPRFYDEHSIMQYGLVLEMLKELKLHGSEHILDVGCGSGKISAELARRIVPQGKVVGLDLSKEMIAYAEDTYKSSNLSFVVGDVMDMQYPKKFDVVTSFWALSWVENQKEALKNILNSLKDGGRIFLMYPLRHDIYNIIDRVANQSYWQKFFVKFQPRLFIGEIEYRLMLSEVGIPAESCQAKKLKYKFKNRYEMENSIRTWSSHLDKITSEPEKVLFIDAVLDAYLQDKNIQSYEMNFSVLHIDAVKKKPNKCFL